MVAIVIKLLAIQRILKLTVMQREQQTPPNSSPKSTAPTIVGMTKLILLALSCIATSTYLYVALSRISFPFAVEWVEASTFIQVVQILKGKPIYTYPSFDFIPTIYTPFYYYIVALFAKFTQQIMFSMRFVSLLASITIFVMIYKICRQRGMSHESSFVAVGLFAASYGVVGYWFDIGRVDTLFLAFLLVGYVLAITQAKPDSLYGMLAGLTLFLSFATKQPALGVTPFIVGYLVVQKRWLKALWLSCSFLVAWTGFVFFMNITSDGWFWIYTFSIPSAHPILWETLFNFWTLYILPKFSLLLIIPIFSILILFLQRDMDGISNLLLFLLFFFLPMTLVSMVTISKQWGYLNGLLPIVAALAINGAESYDNIISTTLRPTRYRIVNHLLSIIPTMALMLQFLNLSYNMQNQIPSKTSWEAGYRTLATLQTLEGRIFIPTSPYLLYMINEQTHFHASSLGDIELAMKRSPTLKDMMEGYVANIRSYISSRNIKVAILPEAKWFDYAFNAERGYHCESLSSEYRALTTLTGAVSYQDRICYYTEDSAK